jgi:hypothetical protein
MGRGGGYDLIPLWISSIFARIAREEWLDWISCLDKFIDDII